MSEPTKKAQVIPTSADLTTLREVISTLEGCSDGSEIHEMLEDAGGVGPVLCSLKRVEAMLEAADRISASPVFGDWTGMRGRVAVLEVQLEELRASAATTEKLATGRLEEIGALEASLTAARTIREEQDAEAERLETELDASRAEIARLSAEAEAATTLGNVRLSQAEIEIARLKGLIDRDRTGLAAGLTAIQKVLAGYSWLPAGQWGSYSYEHHTQETLRREIGWAFDAVNEIAARHLNQSGERADAAFHDGPGPVESINISNLVALAVAHTHALARTVADFGRQLEGANADYRRELNALAKGKLGADGGRWSELGLAVLRAADAWERSGMIPGSSAEMLMKAVRALREETPP